jgi:hypothetical protein
LFGLTSIGKYLYFAIVIVDIGGCEWLASHLLWFNPRGKISRFPSEGIYVVPDPANGPG